MDGEEEEEEDGEEVSGEEDEMDAVAELQAGVAEMNVGCCLGAVMRPNHHCIHLSNVPLVLPLMLVQSPDSRTI